MTGDTHYDLEILAELAEDLLDAGTAQRVREHLAVCDPCGELLADLAAVREVLAATPTPAMPMGVALRVDKALAAEAESRRSGGLGLVETPDWDELMRDAPWERQAEPSRADAQPEQPVRLGVVAEDGSVVPARRSSRRSAQRRRWAMPAIAAAAAVAVVGTAVTATSLLVAGGDDRSGAPTVALPVESSAGSSAQEEPSRSPARALAYNVTNSDHNYSNHELRMPLEDLLGPAPAMQGTDPSGVDQVAKCVSAVSKRSGLEVFAVDQGQYNGQEALVVASWKQRAAQTVRVDVVDPFNCKNLRKPALGRW
ncbi:hypothetical protein [Nonomuraea maritima]|uniref:hypothetical protein n=1 Tax=Nonomuraea maritima TaxID=683260 RepID=UPI00370FB7CD